jgi:hypothetical protein
MIGACTKCGTHGYIMPLHSERGGPPYCFMCAGAWHAEHAPRRRAVRVVIKALKAYEAAGGSLYGQEFDELKIASGPYASLVGRESDTAGSDFADLTSELLDATIALTHPDKHPAERKAEANRVTQELLALKPFVFPAPPPKPPPKYEPRDVSLKESTECFNEPSQPAYPCEDCRYAIPRDYCDPCKAQWEKEQRKEEEREEAERKLNNAHQRYRYRERKRVRDYYVKRICCATCSKKFKPKRSDKKYCCAACRQRAYVKRDGKLSNARPLGRDEIDRTIREIFTANPDNAFTTDDLCDRVFLVKRIERKHRDAVLPIAKKVCERLGEHWDWWRSEKRGGPLVFWNRISVTSYAMARLKSDCFSNYILCEDQPASINIKTRWQSATEEELKAKISPGGDHYKYVVEGGAWWQHCQEDIAKFKKQNKFGDTSATRQAECAS